jgi:beta-lactamase superfamily II metal-dependent hydrolase
VGIPYYEVDVLAVGDAGRSGDAIAMRYSLDGGPPQVLVIDGGNLEAGERLVALIRGEYGTNTVNNVVNGHPDSDHSSGLRRVLEQMDVRALWMHKPWDHVPNILDAFDDDRLTQKSVRRRVREALCAAHGVYEIAAEKRVPVFEPFQGSVIGGLTVLSPSREQYLALLPHFRSTPPAVVRSPVPLRMGGGLAAALDIARWLPATQENEDALLGRKATGPENESSVVLFGNFGGEKILFTGDAGPHALQSAAKYAAQFGVALRDLRLLQVPHHGSRNNLTPSVLNLISAESAFVSVAANSPTHPRPSVTNALRRRGTSIYPTQGKNLRFKLNLADRPGWMAVEAIPWHEYIEGAE